MANVIQFTVKAKDLTGGAFKAATTGLGKMGLAVRGVGRQLFSLKGLIVGAGVVALTKSFIDAADTTEQLGIRLNVMLGSAKEGNKVFQDMTKFASEVPFEFEEIMESATMLSGILKGGSEEIQGWMPLIGDLAATTGLGIQETTEQVQRMLGGGAAAADKFRERGVLAMLGFQSGVSVSAEETKKKLLEAWQDPLSKFRGATKELATSWTGTLSMISDKFFAIKTTIMDAGLFSFFKAIARTIDQYMGKALDATRGSGKEWADTIINGAIWIMKAVGEVADVFRGLKLVFALLQSGFANMVELIGSGIVAIGEGMESAFGWLPSWGGKIRASVAEAKASLAILSLQTQDAEANFQKLATEPMPTTAVDNFVASVKKNMAIVTAEAKAAQDKIATGGKGFVDERTPDQKLTDQITAGEIEIPKQTISPYKKRLAELQAYLTGRMTKFDDAGKSEIELREEQLKLDLLAVDEYQIRELDANQRAFDEAEAQRSSAYSKELNDLKNQLDNKTLSREEYDELELEARIERDAEELEARLLKEEEDIALTEQQRERKRQIELRASAEKVALEKRALIGMQKFKEAIQKGDLKATLGHSAAMLSGVAQQNKTAFEIQKRASIADAIVNTYDAVVQSYNNGGGYPWGLIPAGLMLAAGLANINKIRSTQYSGQAHDGLTDVPRTGTFLLEKGERVVKRDQNRDLTNFLNVGNQSQTITNGNTEGTPTTVIEHLNMEINIEKGGELLDMPQAELEELIASKFIPAMDSLSKQGIRIEDLTVGEQL